MVGIARLLRVPFFLLSTSSIAMGQQNQDPTTMNGGSILAMAGKEAVAVAVDKRFGSGPQMVSIAPRQVWLPRPNVMLAFVGLEGDVESLCQDLQTQVATKLHSALGFHLMDSNQKCRGLSPRAMAAVTSHLLHRRRGAYYVEPIVVGLSGSSQSKKPFLCAMDMIGAQSFSKSFVCSGAASKSLYGSAEALWKPNLEPNELAEICGKAFQSALERDCLSGYGALLYLFTPDGVEEIELASRND